jgi:hypothetical protein
VAGASAQQPNPKKVPKKAPPKHLVPDQVEAAVSTEKTGDAVAADAALEWCAAMQSVFEEQELWRLFHGFRMVAYGFLREAEGGDLGVIVHTAPSRGDDERHMLPVGDIEVPLIIRKGWRYLPATTVAAVPPDPFGGTTTAWARDTTNTNGWGILTAAHIARPDLTGIRLGDLVPLSDGSSAIILNIGPPAIDAMLLALPDDPGDITVDPAHGHLPIENLVAPYSDVEVAGSVSGAVVRKVMSVTDAHGSLDPYFPIRVFLADPCQAGDSGALVRLEDGRAVGIYTAAIGHPEGRHPPEGVCQHLGQVAYCMTLELRHS